MSKTIWKFEVDSPNVHLEMPVGAEILCVQMQRDKPCLWAEVEPFNPIEKRSFMIVGTGHEIEFTNGKYIGTFQMHGGGLVFHLYELV